MLRTKAAWVLGAALALVSSRATATDTKGDTGGKGGTGPGSTPALNEGATPDTGQHSAGFAANGDLATKKAEAEKPWELGASFETHRMFVQDDLNEGTSGEPCLQRLRHLRHLSTDGAGLGRHLGVLHRGLRRGSR